LGWLHLSDTQIGDAGVAALATKDSGLTALRALDLSGTQVGDAGLAALAAEDSGLKALSSLVLSNYIDAADGEAAIRAALPKLEILYRYDDIPFPRLGPSNSGYL
jgi:hypothetical protein